MAVCQRSIQEGNDREEESTTSAVVQEVAVPEDIGKGHQVEVERDGTSSTKLPQSTMTHTGRTINSWGNTLPISTEYASERSCRAAKTHTTTSQPC